MEIVVCFKLKCFFEKYICTMAYLNPISWYLHEFFMIKYGRDSDTCLSRLYIRCVRAGWDFHFSVFEIRERDFELYVFWVIHFRFFFDVNLK